MMEVMTVQSPPQPQQAQPIDTHLPPPPPIATSKQARILIWRHEVASALDEASAGSSSSRSSTGSGLANSGSGSGSSNNLAKATSTSSSFSSGAPLSSSRPRALWKRLSRRLTSRSGREDSPPESPRTAMYADPIATAAALEGVTMVDGEGGTGEAAPAPAPGPAAGGDAQPSHPVVVAKEEHALRHKTSATSSTNSDNRALQERKDRLERAANLLQRGPAMDQRAPAIQVAQ